MTDSVFQIKPPQPNAIVVEVLESILDRARSGELRGFCFVGELTGHEYISTHLGEFGPFAMMGSLHLLAQRIGRDVFANEDR